MIRIVRHPLAVAGSLSRRDGFPPEKSVLVWSAYMLAAEAYTRDLPRAFVGYDALLAGSTALAPPVEPPGHRHSYQSYVCRLPADASDAAAVAEAHGQRNAIMQALEDEGIATRQGTHAVHLLDYYQRTFGYGPMDLPAAHAADRLSLTLPLYAGMTDAEQDRVVDRLSHHLARAGGAVRHG